MCEDIRKQREKFIQNLRKDIHSYKESGFKLDAKKIKEDWENVGKDFPINEK